uniref:Histidine kinase-like ATPase, C-terminal domain-containing protein n=1 Tax=Tanacetum cinerariifolium TaxID=118510 RepID=A0A6L2K559_TANCI|nr:histidine kinase-like ATPase, C-terminal domain-containing protein [Tanacetum cinerariifolium]
MDSFIQPFKVKEDDFTADLLTNLSKNVDHVSSSIVLFSSTLFDFRAEKGFSDTHVGTNDAIELLLKAPMLVDLSLWSCWDYKFAPSLVPLVGSLLSNVTTKELLCLVTKDGKVIRLDHSATVDSFLESFLHGSFFETAVKLISLIALYGGERNVPLSTKMQQIQDKAKKSCMVYFRQLHSHLKRLSQNDLQGSRTESGFKRTFAILSGQDTETFTGTIINVEQLEKQLDKEDFQEIGSKAAFNVLAKQFQMFITSRVYLNDEYVAMTRSYFQQYTQHSILEFCDTLIQHLESVKKLIDERVQLKREYDNWVNETQMQTTEEKVDTSKELDASSVDTESNRTESKEQDTSSRSGNVTHDDDADIRPIYDKEPLAETVPIAEHPRDSRNDSCVTKFLKEVNSRAKVPSNKKMNKNKPVEQKGVTHKQERQIPTGHRFSIQKTFIVKNKTMTPRSCLRWKPTGKIFKTVSLRWVPTGRILTSSTTKVDKEPLNGSNADITNQYECEQNLDANAGTLNLSAVKMEILLEPTAKQLLKILRFKLETLSRIFFDLPDHSLGYIPKEFQRFGAELLVFELRSVIKDAQLAILSECKKSKESLEIKRFSSENEIMPSLETNEPSEDVNRDSGFSAENIRPLCDVGNSTKKKASSGYIGKKGIGFKSVTDAPKIYSNRFHIDSVYVSTGQNKKLLQRKRLASQYILNNVPIGLNAIGLHDWLMLPCNICTANETLKLLGCYYYCSSIEDMIQDYAHMVAASKVSTLKLSEFDIWRIKIEQYIQMIDYAVWEVIENGATLSKTQVVDGVMTVMPITTAEEKAQRRLEVKEISTLMMGIPNEYRNKADLDTMSMDDLYNNFKVYEPDVNRMSSSNTNSQNRDFLSSTNSSTNGVVNTAQTANTANGVSTASTQINVINNLSDLVICAFLDSQPNNENVKAKSGNKETKVVRKNTDAPIVKDLVSDDEEENVSQPKIVKKTVSTSIVQKEFVKPRQKEKTDRKTVKKVEHNRKNTPRPRGNQRN